MNEQTMCTLANILFVDRQNFTWKCQRFLKILKKKRQFCPLVYIPANQLHQLNSWFSFFSSCLLGSLRHPALESCENEYTKTHKIINWQVIIISKRQEKHESTEFARKQKMYLQQKKSSFSKNHYVLQCQLRIFFSSQYSFAHGIFFINIISSCKYCAHIIAIWKK